jgi:hypothetical protein
LLAGSGHSCGNRRYPLLGVKQTRPADVAFDINCPLDQFLRNSRGIKIQGGTLRNVRRH